MGNRYGAVVDRASPRRLGSPNDHAFLIDPNSIRDVHDAEQLVDYMCLIDHRRMLRAGVENVLAAGLRAGGI